MKYVLRVHSDHEYQPFWYAFIELTPELLEFIRNVWLIATPALKDLGKDRTYLRAEFLEYSAIFTGQACPPAFDAFVTNDEFENTGMTRLPDALELPACERVEVMTLQIEDDGFRWTARPKHCDADCYATTIYYKEIFEDA